MIELLVKHKSGSENDYQLNNGQYCLGKSERMDIILPDQHASRMHARLVVQQDSVSLEDADSKNGIWYDNKRINKSMQVNNGDQVRIGSTLLQFKQNIPVLTKPLTPVHDNELYLFKRQLHELLVTHLDMYKRTKIQSMQGEELRQQIILSANEVMHENKLDLPEQYSKDQIIDEVVAEAIGLGPLEAFLDDDQISEIMVNGPDKVFVERQGKISSVDQCFNSNQSLMGIIERIVSPIGRRIDEGSPMVDARLADGSRVNAIIPPLSLNGPILTIRKFAKHQFSIDDLVRSATLDRRMATFLEICVRNKKNVIVSGGTGSGKTTTLNIMSSFIPENERIITIEDAAELKLHQQHLISLESRPANAEGKGRVTIRDLVKNSLRMRPDRIVIGECRSGEALDMLQAMNTGHDGSLTTGHANSPRDMLSRLEVMVLMSGIDIPVKTVREQIASALDIIIQQTRFSDGSRRITSIVEVDGMEGDVILLQKIFDFKRQGRDESGAITGQFRTNGYAPAFYQELEQSGISVDRSIFQQNTSTHKD